jgi:hypothetical protein
MFRIKRIHLAEAKIFYDFKKLFAPGFEKLLNLHIFDRSIKNPSA